MLLDLLGNNKYEGKKNYRRIISGKRKKYDKRNKNTTMEKDVVMTKNYIAL